MVISSPAYQNNHINLILMAISSNVSALARTGEVSISDWGRAGLVGPSVVKAAVTTVERRLVIRHLGELADVDKNALVQSLKVIIGP